MLRCGKLGAGHLPVIFAIVFVLNLGFTYVFAVVHKDVDPVFPYISATGSNRPESCLFSLLLNISSCLSMVVIYLRYCLVNELIRGSDVLIGAANTMSLFFGLLGAFGMMVVANFQESAVITVHLIAACVCFGSGCIYMSFHSFITLKMHPLYTNRRIGIIRTTLTIGGIVAFCTALTFGVIASKVFHSYYPDLPTPRPWRRNVWMPGFEFHVVSAFAEWTMAVFHVGFLLSFSRDFEKLRAKVQVESLVTHLDRSPLWHSYDDLVN